MPQKNAMFCMLKGKNPWWPLKKPPKYWSQQNQFVNVPKSSQTQTHRSKVKVAKLEKINIMNIIKGVKLIKCIYTCRSWVGKRKNHHLISHIQ
jgi:hypothetical protein